MSEKSSGKTNIELKSLQLISIDIEKTFDIILLHDKNTK